MSDSISEIRSATPSSTADVIRSGLRRRYRKEKTFRRIGLGAIVFGLLTVLFLFFSIGSKGYSAFQQTFVLLSVTYDSKVLGLGTNPTEEDLQTANYEGLVKKVLRDLYPTVSGRKQKRKLYKLISPGAFFEIRQRVLHNPSLLDTTEQLWLPADDDVDMLMKGYIDRTLDEDSRRLSDLQITWVDTLEQQGKIRKRFNSTFFMSGDSREPELAGIGGAMMGTAFTLLITLTLAFPLGIATAIYLEEFAPRNRWIDLIEIIINNLAAVPSIVFGLLGLAVFLNFFGLPRSAPIVGGLVLALMTLPTIIIASRAALQSVPPSIREAALGMGASLTQSTLQHVLPLAMPGMLTGSIIGMARALGETAPLLMIGMVAFIVDVPQKLTDPSTVLPVQIYLWLDSPERAFVERSSAAIIVLLVFLISMNILAVILRRKFERRW